MANWKHTLKVAHIIHDVVLSPRMKGERVAALLREEFSSLLSHESREWDAALDEIVTAFEFITGYDGATPEEELDEVMTSLYGWADSEVEPFGEWPPNKMLWIEPR